MRDMQRRNSLALWLLFVTFGRGLGLSSASRQPSDHLPLLGITNGIDDAIIQSSPAVAAVQEADVARRILKQRSSRGRPGRLSTSDVLLKQKRPTQKTHAPATKTKTRKTAKRLQGNNSPRRAIEFPYKSAIEALRVYHEKHSHLVMPRKYVIEKGEGYPQEWHGIDLAGTVYDMRWWSRHVQEQPERVTELNKLGFVWERLQPEWNLILEALITYRTLHDDLLVPSKFVVPFGDTQWSRSTWSISLGKAVYRIRSRGDFLRGPNAIKRRQQLEALGFVWDVQEHRFEKFCNALRYYAKNEADSKSSTRKGALKIPSQYVVPETDIWPRSLWGYPLGAKCTAVRQKELYVKGHPDRLRILAEIGFHVNGNDSLRWLEVVHAAAVYSQMHNRNLDVPQSFVVPAPPRRIGLEDDKFSISGSDDAWPWPESLWGFPLGQRLRDIRLKGYYLRGPSADARRRQLDALGFNWNPKPGRRKGK